MPKQKMQGVSNLCPTLMRKRLHHDATALASHRMFENDALSPLLGAASARLGSSSLEQQDATIG